MRVDFQQITDQITHPGDKGVSREDILRRFLKEYLPERFGVGSGQVVDAFGSPPSAQQDIVIYDALDCPLLYANERTQIFPCESVYAVIQVRSSIDTGGIKRCAEQIASCKRLQKQPPERVLGGGLEISDEPIPTLGAVFAFSTRNTLQTLAHALLQWNSDIEEAIQTNMVCVLNRAILDYLPEHEGAKTVLICHAKGDALLFFYSRLFAFLRRFSPLPFDISEYIQEFNVNVEWIT